MPRRGLRPTPAPIYLLDLSMTAATVFVCPPEHVRVEGVLLAGYERPTCDAGEGEWQTVLLAQPFDPSQLNSAELGGAFGAGFVVMGTGLAIAWAARMIVQSIRDAF